MGEKKINLTEDFVRLPIAHRGLHDCGGSFGSGRSENSLSAVQEAINRDYGIEVDIQLSYDGVPVVFHDDDLERLFRRPERVRDMLFKDLVNLQLPNGDRIPCLNSLLDLVSGRVPVLLEIKDQDGRLGQEVGRLEKEVAKALNSYDGPVALMSFNPFSVKKIAEYLPHLPRGLITESFSSVNWPTVEKKKLKALREFSALKTLALSFISHEFSDLKNSQMLNASKGLTRLCWTVRNDNEAKRAFDLADNITFEGFFPSHRKF
ncbi:MAG: glycerophosphodiester phosphodiesterase family protein [Pseudomonadota bacterium]|nr:glycerophosphodiester phosphodiesterase family protein [Pseudomonadota bacterium]